MVSLALNLALRMAGIRAQMAPPRKPAANMQGRSTKAGASGSPYSATQVAATAPMSNCPSAPIFQTSAWKAMASPTPQIMRGMALTVVSDSP